MVICGSEKYLLEVESGVTYRTQEEVFFYFEEERVCIFAEASGERVL